MNGEHLNRELIDNLLPASYHQYNHLPFISSSDIADGEIMPLKEYEPGV